MSTPGDHTPRWPQYLAGTTTHARRGGIQNAFRYGVDYVLLDPNSTRGPLLFSRNRWNLTSVMDRNHGGTSASSMTTQTSSREGATKASNKEMTHS